jgi:nitrite reductase/ring-hydroxylating ferredoxin subunit
LAEGGCGTYYAGNTIVVVFRNDGNLYAINNTCTHEDGPIGEGTVNGTVIACPYHDWRFDFTSGKCLTTPDRDVATYATRERDGFVWVGAAITQGASIHSRGGEHNDGMTFATDEGRPADWTGEH